MTDQRAVLQPMLVEKELDILGQRRVVVPRIMGGVAVIPQVNGVYRTVQLAREDSVRL